jgi:predicted RNA-binding protein with EMAP domain
MAKAQLMRIAEQAIDLFKMIKEGDNLEGWVAAKITKANDYINAVHQNLTYDDAKDQTQTVGSDDDYIAELRKNLEQQIKS